jgi:hypothetical protein
MEIIFHFHGRLIKLKINEIWRIKQSYPETCLVKIHDFNEWGVSFTLVNGSSRIFRMKKDTFLDWYKPEVIGGIQ